MTTCTQQAPFDAFVVDAGVIAAPQPPQRRSPRSRYSGLVPVWRSRRAGPARRLCACSLPARALEEFVVERIAEATADGQLAQRVYNKLTLRLDAERKTIESLRGVLATQVAEAANITKKLTEDLTTFEGRARLLIEDKLRAEANKLGEAERRQRALERTHEELADAERHRDWFVSALRSFAKVWGDMTPENQGRFLRALVAKVSVDERDGSCTVELVDFDAAAGTTKEAA